MDRVNIFISGGCKNGKSFFAQQLAKKQADHNPLYYIATMSPVDNEDRERIKRHRQEREGWGFTTIEQSNHICEMIADRKGSFLLDSVTALLSNEMFKLDGTVDLEAYDRVSKDLVGFAKETGNTVFVSDYIYSDAMQYEKLTEAYRKGLAYIDCALAQECDLVIEVCYGNINIIKGEMI